MTETEFDRQQIEYDRAAYEMYLHPDVPEIQAAYKSAKSRYFRYMQNPDKFKNIIGDNHEHRI